MSVSKSNRLELLVEPVYRGIYFSKDTFLVPSELIISDEDSYLNEGNCESFSYNRAEEIVKDIVYFTFKKQGFFEDDLPEHLDKKIGSLPTYFIVLYDPNNVIKSPDSDSNSSGIFSYNLSNDNFNSERSTLEEVIKDKKEELSEFVNKSKLGRFFYIHPLTVPIWTAVGLVDAYSMKSLYSSPSQVSWQIPLVFIVSAIGLIVDLNSSENQEMEHAFGLEYDKKRLDLLKKLKVVDISEIVKKKKFHKTN